MWDLSFKPLGEVQVGDEIVGFASENGKHGYGNSSKNNLCKSIVLNKKTKRDKIVKIKFQSGREIRCTKDHVWLSKRYDSWTYKYQSVKKSWFIAHIIDPTPELPIDLVFDAGWLAGIYDGEGHGIGIAQSKCHNPDVYNKIKSTGTKLGINLTELKNDMGFSIKGKRQAYVDFLNKVRPTKQEQLRKRILGRAIKNPADRIISIEPDGFGDVMCLTTSTGNYVIWGFASKNSSKHPESIEELLDWPNQRFEAFYEAYIKREAVEGILEHKGMMINALFSNTNYDENVEERTKAIDDLEEKCSEAIEVIYNGKSAREAEISDDNPFMAASKRSLEESGVPDLDVFLNEDEKDEGLKGDLDDFEFEVDQA